MIKSRVSLDASINIFCNKIVSCWLLKAFNIDFFVTQSEPDETEVEPELKEYIESKDNFCSVDIWGGDTSFDRE